MTASTHVSKYLFCPELVYNPVMVNLAPGKRIHRILCGALILALVLSQLLALAHRHALDSPSSHHCALCLYAQHFGDSLPSGTFHFFPPAVFAFIAAGVSVCSLISVTSLSFLSRAPPVELK